VAYELFANAFPYTDLPHDDSLAPKICQGLRPNIDKLPIPQLLKNLIKKCWDSDPVKRPSAKELEKTINDWYLEVVYRKDTCFCQQYLGIREEYNTFSQTTPYQVPPTVNIHSKLINTKQIAQLFQESEEQAPELEIKKIEQEINQPLTGELKVLVSNFLQIYKKRERGSKEVTKKNIKELKEKLRAEKFEDKNIEKIIDYCSRLVKLEQEQLQAQVEINTNK